MCAQYNAHKNQWWSFSAVIFEWKKEWMVNFIIGDAKYPDFSEKSDIWILSEILIAPFQQLYLGTNSKE